MGTNLRELTCPGVNASGMTHIRYYNSCGADFDQDSLTLRHKPFILASLSFYSAPLRRSPFSFFLTPKYTIFGIVVTISACLAVATIVAIILTPVDILREHLFPQHGAISLAVFVVGLAYFTVYDLFIGDPFPSEFYTTIAQVLPVLILATVVPPQRRYAAHQL